MHFAFPPIQFGSGEQTKVYFHDNMESAANPPSKYIRCHYKLVDNETLLWSPDEWISLTKSPASPLSRHFTLRISTRGPWVDLREILITDFPVRLDFLERFLTASFWSRHQLTGVPRDGDCWRKETKEELHAGSLRMNHNGLHLHSEFNSSSDD